MINWPTILKLLGFTILGISMCLISPLVIALSSGDGGTYPLLMSLLTGIIAGGLAVLTLRPGPHEITRKEGVLLVGLAWLAGGGSGCPSLLVFSIFQRIH